MSDFQLSIGSVIINILGSSPFGIRSVEVPNWAGIILIIPKDEYQKLVVYDDTRNLVVKSGVYILTGVVTVNNSNNGSEKEIEKIYIGESDNVFNRIEQHVKNANRDFESVLMILSKDDYLTKTHILYLESRLIELVAQAKRVRLDNGKVTSIPYTGSSTKRTIETFLQYLQVVLPLIGYTFLLPISKLIVPQIEQQSNLDVTPEQQQIKLVFEYQTRDKIEIKAHGIYSDGQLVVESGAILIKADALSIPTSSKRIKTELLDRNLLVEKDTKTWILKEPYTFTSLSTAAGTLTGRSLNGRDYWKLANGKSFGEWQDNTVKQNIEE